MGVRNAANGPTIMISSAMTRMCTAASANTDEIYHPLAIQELKWGEGPHGPPDRMNHAHKYRVYAICPPLCIRVR